MTEEERIREIAREIIPIVRRHAAPHQYAYTAADRQVILDSLHAELVPVYVRLVIRAPLMESLQETVNRITDEEFNKKEMKP